MKRVSDSIDRKCGCRHYSLILMDINMPKMNGLEAAKAILAAVDQRQIERPYIVGVSGDSSAELRDACQESGISRLISKPLAKAQLEDLVEDMQNAFKFV